MKHSRILLTLVVGALACAEASAPAPATIEIVTAAPDSSVVGGALAAMPTFEVRTAKGKAIAGVDIEVTTGSQSGSLASAPIKTGKGPTPIGVWTLGTLVGNQTVRIAVVDEPTVPVVTLTVQAVAGPAATMFVLVGDNQLAGANTAVPNPIRVQVTDAFGNALVNKAVTWVATGGGNVATPTSLTNAQGIATAPAWTLGTFGGGPQQLTAAVGAVTKTVNAQVETASIQIMAAAADTVLYGHTTTASFVILDSIGEPAKGVPFTVEVLTGDGVMTGTPATTDAGGAATSIGTWRVGAVPGAQTVRISAAGASPKVLTTIAATQYSLEIVYLGSANLFASAFESAKDRITKAIVGRLTSLTFGPNTDIGPCVTGQVINGETIPGLRIYASVEAIDGTGGVLGSAGPCYIRNSSKLSVVGRMRFDAADLDVMQANNTLNDVILHEMLHVVGVGTLWDDLGVLANPCTSTPCAAPPQFTGTRAIAACTVDAGGGPTCATGVPVEDCTGLGATSCGGGTINSHWREATFRTELMTGYVSGPTIPNPFSKFTIESLGDLGYVVNPFVANAYTVPASLMSIIDPERIKMPEPTRPIAALDDHGRIVKVFNQH